METTNVKKKSLLAQETLGKPQSFWKIYECSELEEIDFSNRL